MKTIMKLNKQKFSILTALCVAVLWGAIQLPVQAAEQAKESKARAPVSQLVEGKDYVRLSSPQSVPGKQVQVVEFFSFMCPHCANFEKDFGPWADKKKGSVVVERIPVLFGRAEWETMARLHYALEGMNAMTEARRLSIYRTIHQDNKNLWEEKPMREWLAEQGLDADKVVEAMGGFVVSGRINSAQSMAQKYQVNSVPSLFVDGKFAPSADNITGYPRLLQVVDGLILKAKQERK